MSDRRNLIIYHGGCPDGFGAAWIAGHALGHENCTFHAAKYGERPPSVNHYYDDIYVLDFGYSFEEMKQLNDGCSRLIWIDHHVSNIDTMDAMMVNSPGLQVIFATDHSGVMLTWSYFRGSEAYVDGVEPHWVFQYIEDRDIWKHDLWETEAVNAYLLTIPFTFQAYDELMRLDINVAYDRGVSCLRTREAYVRAAKAQYRIGYNWGYKVAFVNATYHWGSDICGELLIDLPDVDIASYWFMQQDGRIKYGLRSRDNGPDVSKICQEYEGGGHKHAAGFVGEISKLLAK